MPYESQNPGPMGGEPGAMSMGPDEMAPASGEGPQKMEAGGGEGVLHIGPAELPKGMKLSKGDIVEFKVIGDADGEGDWPIEYNYGKEGKGEEGKSESWEEGLMKHMSPRSGGDDGMAA